MTKAGKRRTRGPALLLAAAWLPFLVLQCPNCPDASTRLVHCVSTAQARPAAAKAAPDHADCHGGSGAGRHSDSPASSCCSSADCRITTLSARTTVDAPTTAVLPWILDSRPDTPRWETPTWPAPRDPRPHSPPLFLLLQSLLL